MTLNFAEFSHSFNEVCGFYDSRCSHRSKPFALLMLRNVLSGPICIDLLVHDDDISSLAKAIMRLFLRTHAFNHYYFCTSWYNIAKWRIKNQRF